MGPENLKTDWNIATSDVSIPGGYALAGVWTGCLLQPGIPDEVRMSGALIDAALLFTSTLILGKVYGAYNNIAKRIDETGPSFKHMRPGIFRKLSRIAAEERGKLAEYNAALKDYESLMQTP
ncbi:MAG: hypothetical protein HYS81_03375 [Candidatus Aenigmatarchaeota archaeon]|nr:MAG: hypothetical protein HYS81_03375 [Candidatus Aenigmarchaeota archaeon]